MVVVMTVSISVSSRICSRLWAKFSNMIIAFAPESLYWCRISSAVYKGFVFTIPNQPLSKQKSLLEIEEGWAFEAQCDHLFKLRIVLKVPNKCIYMCRNFVKTHFDIHIFVAMLSPKFFTD